MFLTSPKFLSLHSKPPSTSQLSKNKLSDDQVKQKQKQSENNKSDNNKRSISNRRYSTISKGGFTIEMSKDKQNKKTGSRTLLRKSSIIKHTADQKALYQNDSKVVLSPNQLFHSIMTSSIKSKYQDKQQKHTHNTQQNNFLSPTVRPSLNKKSMQSLSLNSSTINLTESKWQKIIELYTMREQLAKKYHFPSASQLKKKYPILPGGEFYRLLIKQKVYEKQWRINFPQTICLDVDGNIVMVYTDKMTGVLCKKIIQKQGKQRDNYRDQVLRFKQFYLDELIAHNKLRLFRQIKIQQNPNAPLSIMKYTEDNAFQFETDVQTYRNFIQRKLRPTRDSIVQRYIYSNNLKSMIFRLCYNRHVNGTQGGTNTPEYEGIRFQNQKPIFKQSQAKSYAEVHKLTSIISLSQKRIGTMKFSKITNLKALEKFIVQTKQLQRLLEYTQKVIIRKLYVDFIVDVFDIPWVINIKYCEVAGPHISNDLHCSNGLNSAQKQIGNVSSCRLCCAILKKQNLKNTVSVRMLCEFISHLRKRTKHQELHKIDFVSNVNINSKENKMSSVCRICYKVIIHQLQLIKIEKKLARICNIVPQSAKQQFIEGQKKGSMVGQYKQWRLMIYFQDIKNVTTHENYLPGSGSGNYSGYSYARNNYGNHAQLSVPPQFMLKYQLCPKITQTFPCQKESLTSPNLCINQLKLHYFYSQTTNIEEFINSTQILISLYTGENQGGNAGQKQSGGLNGLGMTSNSGLNQQKLLASGSTHILSSFNLSKSSSISLKSLMQNGQRQTTTVLLFFKNKKYCELTLKIGLVYDGSYNVSNIPTKGNQNDTNIGDSTPFVKWNQVWFSKTICNSNPLPKEWMQIFGRTYNYNNTLSTYNEETDQNEGKSQQNEEKVLKRILQETDQFEGAINQEEGEEDD